MLSPKILCRFVAPLGLVVAFALTGCGTAESADDPGGEDASGLGATEAETVEPRVTVPTGTQMTFTLTESLSTETNSAGDRFTATLVRDVTGPEGAVLIPAGTRALGTISVAREAASADEPAVLQLSLESIEVDGETVPLVATVVSTNVDTDTRDSGGETAAKIAVGAAAGALIGRAIGGDRQGALIGAGAGAAAGTGVALSTDEGHATIAGGSTVTIAIDEPIQIR